VKLWQRNLIGVAVSAAALTVIVTADLGPEWMTYRGTAIPEHVVPAGTDDRAWRVQSIRHLNAEPDGTVLNIVTVERTGGPVDQGCVAVITDGRRRWSAEPLGLAGPLPPDGVSTICGKPGPIQFSFLLPGDAVPTALDITELQGRILVRLEL
jgi:hypothetical protein